MRSKRPNDSQMGECLKFAAAKLNKKPNISTPKIFKPVKCCENSQTKIPVTKPNTNKLQ